MAITAAQAIEAVKGSKGFVTTIAKRLGCGRGNVYALMNKYPTVNQAVLDEREQLKDFAEGKLFEQIQDGNMTGIIFYLKTQAKDRGYVERQEMEHSGEVNLQIDATVNRALDKIYGDND